MDEMKSGMKIAYQGVKEEMETIVAELARKGIEKPKGFSVLEQFIKDMTFRMQDKYIAVNK